jgi:hypothetical protein
MFASWCTRKSSTVIRYIQDRTLGDITINQTKKPQPFLVPIARCADGDEGALQRRWGSQLASLDGVTWIMGTFFYQFRAFA